MRFDLDVEVRPGEPLSLAIEDIDEDPEQPRREFDETALRELAETIKAVGVRQPISVRVHPKDPERWMLNFGARRLRASKLAGKTDIPGFVDQTASSYDQIIENEQREGLRPLELAMFIRKQLAAGQSQAEIARRMGKSRQYVTYACSLIDPPAWLLDLYRSGRCRGILELHELRRLHAEHPHEVVRWLAGVDSVGRSDLQRLKAVLDDQTSKAGGEPRAPQGLNPFESPTYRDVGQLELVLQPRERLNPLEARTRPGADEPRVVSQSAEEVKPFNTPPRHDDRQSRAVLEPPEGLKPFDARSSPVSTFSDREADFDARSSNHTAVDDHAVTSLLEQVERLVQGLSSSSEPSHVLLLARLRAALLRLARG